MTTELSRILSQVADGVMSVDQASVCIEQLSAQTAEPAAWMNPNESFAPDAFIWNEDDIHPEYNVPVYTRPAKTEQPSLSDAEILALHLKHAEESRNVMASANEQVIAFARALLSAQRQDSDKDAERYRFMREDTRVGIEIEGRELSHEYLDEAIDRAIANGAPK